MGKKNIQPNSSQPVFRSLVARPALEKLSEENLTEGNQGQMGGMVFPAVDLGKIGAIADILGISIPRFCSYDGDDE